MDRTTDQKIRRLAGEVAEDMGCRVDDLQIAGSGRRTLLRIFIDKESGVSLDDCATFSRRLEGYLDVEDIIPTSYVLEVSSPGLDRPLRTLGDFQRYVGRLARVVTKEKVGDGTFFLGRIQDVSDGVITLVTGGGKKEPVEEIRIPYEQVAKAKLEIEVT